jgi:hypothetical protein
MGDLQNYVATANQSPIDLYSAPGNDQLGNGVQVCYPMAMEYSLRD